MADFSTGPEPVPLVNLDLRRTARIGAAAFFLMIGVLGLWSAFTQIGGAVISNGTTIVRGNPKVVQSLDGGLIETIAVREGDLVQEGALLMRLDATLLSTNLEISRNRLAAALALRTRLLAEQLGASELDFRYPDLPFTLPDVTEHEAGQREIFTVRRAVIEGVRAQLAETLAQYNDQIRGLEGQISATQTQLDLLGQDIAAMQSLVDNNLRERSRLSELQRARADLLGQMASLSAEIDRIENAKRDAELQSLQTERSFLEDVVTELREVTATTEELTLEIVTRSEQLDRIEIRAPVTGIIHQMQTTTEGAVIPPGETILEVVPVGEGMEFEVRVDPRSIDQVHQDQAAQVVLSSFDPQQTPRLVAHVASISPGTVEDQATGQAYYRVALRVTPDELARLGDVPLMPGMPIEAYLETGNRTVLQYLLHPISSHLRQAFRE